MIPRTFDEWKHCIVHGCKVNLTRDFAMSRLTVCRNRAHPETQQFIRLYGEAHLQNIINWFSLYEH